MSKKEVPHDHDNCAECIRRDTVAYTRGRLDLAEYLVRLADGLKKDND